MIERERARRCENRDRGRNRDSCRPVAKTETNIRKIAVTGIPSESLVQSHTSGDRKYSCGINGKKWKAICRTLESAPNNRVEYRRSEGGVS